MYHLYSSSLFSPPLFLPFSSSLLLSFSSSLLSFLSSSRSFPLFSLLPPLLSLLFLLSSLLSRLSSILSDFFFLSFPSFPSPPSSLFSPLSSLPSPLSSLRSPLSSFLPRSLYRSLSLCFLSPGLGRREWTPFTRLCAPDSCGCRGLGWCFHNSMTGRRSYPYSIQPCPLSGTL